MWRQENNNKLLNNNSSNEFDQFQLNVLNELNKSVNRFIWINGQHYFHADRLGRVFYASIDECPCNFEKDVKVNLIPERKVSYWQIDKEDLEKKINIHDLTPYEVIPFLEKNGIEKMGRPNLEIIDFEKELMNCCDYAHYILINAVKQTSDYTFNELKKIIDPLVHYYFKNSCDDFNSFIPHEDKNNYQSGDLLFFFNYYSSNISYETTVVKPSIHVGFYYYDEKQQKHLLYDLYSRNHDKSEKASIVDFTHYAQYTKNMEIIHVPLKEIFNKLQQELQLNTKSKIQINNILK